MKGFLSSRDTSTKGENDRREYKRDKKTQKGVFRTMFLSYVVFGLLRRACFA